MVLLEVNKTPYGQITVNVRLKDGVAQLDTVNIVKTVRKKYKSIDKNKQIV